jgi:hypothetical protein
MATTGEAPPELICSLVPYMMNIYDNFAGRAGSLVSAYDLDARFFNIK